MFKSVSLCTVKAVRYLQQDFDTGGMVELLLREGVADAA